MACWRSHQPRCRTLTHHAAAGESALIQTDDSALRQGPVTPLFGVLICAIISARMTADAKSCPRKATIRQTETRPESSKGRLPFFTAPRAHPAAGTAVVRHRCGQQLEHNP